MGNISAIDYWNEKYLQEQMVMEDSEYTHQDFWPLLKKYFVSHHRYLDVGCGLGSWMLFLRRQGYHVEGIDTAEKVIQRLKAYDPGLHVQVGSITGIPYSDESVDGVIALGTLEYADGEVVKAIGEMRRVLKKGGLLFLEVPIINGVRRFGYIPLKQLDRLVRRCQGTAPVFSNYLFDRRTLGQLLEREGFVVEVIQPHDLPEESRHYGLWIDWPFLRGGAHYELNMLGRIVKKVCNALSLWVAATGVVIAARKK